MTKSLPVPMSARKTLRERLDQARRENFIDLRVTTPAFEGLHIRCRAMTKQELEAAIARDNANDAGTIDVLVETCLGIWEEVDGKGVSPVDGFSGLVDLDTMELSGDLPTFSSPELAEALGLVEQSAEATVRALLAPTDTPRLARYGGTLLDFSTGANEQIVRAHRGN